MCLWQGTWGKKPQFSIIYLMTSYTPQHNHFCKLWKLYSCYNDLVISPNALEHDTTSKLLHKVWKIITWLRNYYCKQHLVQLTISTEFEKWQVTFGSPIHCFSNICILLWNKDIFIVRAYSQSLENLECMCLSKREQECLHWMSVVCLYVLNSSIW